jgi:hypothetical protein
VSTIDASFKPLTPRCATHEGEPATGTCARCGAFFCVRCVQHVSDKDLCEACAARPEVRYLELFRLKLWGKRDGSAWAVLLASLGGVAVVVHELTSRTSWPHVLAFGACALTGALFFLGLRWAREALVLVPLVAGAACWAQAERLGGTTLIIVGLLAVSIYFDTRSQLFFRRPITPERLQRLWNRLENNPRARDAMSLGFASLLFPLFIPLAVIMGVVALRRVDPEAVPPIGRRGQAIAAIVFSLLSLAAWTWLYWLGKRSMS